MPAERAEGTEHKANMATTWDPSVVPTPAHLLSSPPSPGLRAGPRPRDPRGALHTEQPPAKSEEQCQKGGTWICDDQGCVWEGG